MLHLAKAMWNNTSLVSLILFAWFAMSYKPNNSWIICHSVSRFSIHDIHDIHYIHDIHGGKESRPTKTLDNMLIPCLVASQLIDDPVHPQFSRTESNFGAGFAHEFDDNSSWINGAWMKCSVTHSRRNHEKSILIHIDHGLLAQLLYKGCTC